MPRFSFMRCVMAYVKAFAFCLVIAFAAYNIWGHFTGIAMVGIVLGMVGVVIYASCIYAWFVFTIAYTLVIMPVCYIVSRFRSHIAPDYKQWCKANTPARIKQWTS